MTGMSEAFIRLSSANIGMRLLSLSQAQSASLSAGRGCSTSSTPMPAIQFIISRASSFVFQPSLASTRSGFEVTSLIPSIIFLSFGVPTLIL